MLKPDYTPLEITLLQKSKNITNMRYELSISSATLAKIGKREHISLNTIAQICEYLNVPIQKVVRFTRE